MSESGLRSAKPWRPSERVVEETTYRVFSTEIRDILTRCAAAIEDFIDIVESQFARHPEAACRVSLFERPAARRAWARVTALRGDARGLVIFTIDFYGVFYPIPSEPLTCARVKRPIVPKGRTVARRSIDQAELFGWLTASESSLVDMLGPIIPVVLENRQEIESRRSGLVNGPGPDGVPIMVADPALAESDRSIAAFFPLLVRDGFDTYAHAVADSALLNLRDKAARLRAWRPQKVKSRTLYPDWESLRASSVAVVRHERRAPTTIQDTIARPDFHVTTDIRATSDPLWQHLAAFRRRLIEGGAVTPAEWQSLLIDIRIEAHAAGLRPQLGDVEYIVASRSEASKGDPAGGWDAEPENGSIVILIAWGSAGAIELHDIADGFAANGPLKSHRRESAIAWAESWMNARERQLCQPAREPDAVAWIRSDTAARLSGLDAGTIRKRAKREGWPTKRTGARMLAYPLERLTAAWPDKKFAPRRAESSETQADIGGTDAGRE